MNPFRAWNVFSVVGILTIGVVLFMGSLGAAHLWHDHINYHTNMQLLELIRSTVVDKHPELEETNEQTSTP